MKNELFDMKYFDTIKMKWKGKTINFDRFLSKTVLKFMQSHKMVQFPLEKLSFVKIVQCNNFHPDLQLWQQLPLVVNMILSWHLSILRCFTDIND